MQVLNDSSLHIARLGVQHMGSYHCHVRHRAGNLNSRPPYVIQFDCEISHCPHCCAPHSLLCIARFVQKAITEST
ncbi:unnamed protein product [Protopolystoma xenopodis]|uniref:Ig-like domain-containing protein n=1 Tax=Protopolystoma xenopodis TaxID=117903 RepID=A0A3S5CHR9_9PLAT|nr:unnamed protein product [Protopolystoma xenopodis]